MLAAPRPARGSRPRRRECCPTALNGLLEVVVHDDVLVLLDRRAIPAMRNVIERQAVGGTQFSGPGAGPGAPPRTAGGRRRSPTAERPPDIWRAPWTSMSMTTCRPVPRTRAISLRSVPYRFPCTSADSANSPASRRAEEFVARQEVVVASRRLARPRRPRRARNRVAEVRAGARAARRAIVVFPPPDGADRMIGNGFTRDSPPARGSARAPP